MPVVSVRFYRTAGLIVFILVVLVGLGMFLGGVPAPWPFGLGGAPGSWGGLAVVSERIPWES